MPEPVIPKRFELNGYMEGFDLDAPWDAYFDRAGYFVITKPAGWFDKHPLGEANPALGSIVRYSRYHALYAENLETQGEPDENGVADPIPLKKLDVVAMEKVAVRGTTANMYEAKDIVTKEGTLADKEEWRHAYDDGLNATITVGTAKDQATWSGAAVASSSGDAIVGYAGGVGNVYTEYLNLDGKIGRLVRGTIAAQGITLKRNTGYSVRMASSFNTVLQNLTIDGDGGSDVCVYAGGYACIVRDCVAFGADGYGFQATGAAVLMINCIAYGNLTGFWATANTANHIFCTASKNTEHGFAGSALNRLVCHFCISSNGTAGGVDFANIYVLASAWNTSGDGTADGVDPSINTFVETDFVDYAGDNFRLKGAVAATTAARREGYPPVAFDMDGNERKHVIDGSDNYVFGGASDPDPVVLDFPDVGHVTENDTVQGVTGTCHLPGENEVVNLVGFGEDGTEFTGNVTLPAVGDVQITVQYGASGTQYTGTLVLPTESQTLNGVGFGASGTEFTGNVTLPAETDVRTTIQYGANGTQYTGNVTLPSESNVVSSIKYGANGTQYTGSYDEDYPAETNVRSGVVYANTTYTGNVTLPLESTVVSGTTYGANGTQYTGNVTLPVVGNVKTGIKYGANGTEYTGSYDEDYPAETDVRLAVVYGNTTYTGNVVLPTETDVRTTIQYGANGTQYTGNVVLPTEVTVQTGTKYGANGTEYTGSYTAETPVVPTWTADPVTASGQVTLSLTAAAVTHTIYLMRRVGNSAWTAVGNRSGTGTIVDTDVTNGTMYEYTAYSSVGGVPSGWIDSQFARPYDPTFSASPIPEGIQGYWDVMVANNGTPCTLKHITRVATDELNNEYDETETQVATQMIVEWKPNMRELKALGIDTEETKPLIASVKFGDSVKAGDRILFTFEFIPESVDVVTEYEVTQVIRENEDALRRRVLITPRTELGQA